MAGGDGTFPPLQNMIEMKELYAYVNELHQVDPFFYNSSYGHYDLWFNAEYCGTCQYLVNFLYILGIWQISKSCKLIIG